MLKREKISTIFRRHRNLMEGACVDHKDHFAVVSESIYLGHNIEIFQNKWPKIQRQNLFFFKY